MFADRKAEVVNGVGVSSADAAEPVTVEKHNRIVSVLEQDAASLFPVASSQVLKETLAHLEKLRLSKQ